MCGGRGRGGGEQGLVVYTQDGKRPGALSKVEDTWDD